MRSGPAEQNVREACLDADTAAACIAGTLSDDEERRVEAHIDRCSGCRRLLSQLAVSNVSFRISRNGADATFPGAEWGGVDALPRGARVGRYRIDAVLGVGGMGVVYVAHDPPLRRKVALKVVRNDVSDDSRGDARMLREAQAMASLSHPNVVTVYDVVMSGDRVAIAMELIDGQSLRAWLAAANRTWREIVHAYVEAGRGLIAAHAVGLVHRDFKPDNVLCDAKGRVCVTDFGLARHDAPPESSSGLPADVSTTHAGALAGTPAYMAPEQFDGATIDARTDQFSFCVALHESLYGVRPFARTSKTLLSLASAVRAGRLVEPPRTAGVPARIHRVLTRGLRVDPKERYPSMTELLADLVDRPAPRWRGGAVATVALTAVVLVGWRVMGVHGTPSKEVSAAAVTVSVGVSAPPAPTVSAVEPVAALPASTHAASLPSALKAFHASTAPSRPPAAVSSPALPDLPPPSLAPTATSANGAPIIH